MDKQLKDYLHFYLGCQMYAYTLESVTNGWLEKQMSKNPQMGYSYELTAGNLKKTLEDGYLPILRKLESMAEDEALHIAKNCFYHNEMRYPDSDYKVSREGNVYVVNLNNDWFEKELRIGLSSGNIWYTKPTIEDRVHHAFDSFHYLLSRGFDLFGLCDAGLAIDKATIKS